MGYVNEIDLSGQSVGFFLSAFLQLLSARHRADNWVEVSKREGKTER